MNEIHNIYGGAYPSYSTAKRMFEEFEETENPSPKIEKKKSPEKVKRINLIQDALNNNPS